MQQVRRNLERVDSSPALAGDLGWILLMMLGLYALLMLRYPIIYGGDPIARLVNSSRILNGHQLPLLQILIDITVRYFHGPKSIFLLMAFISAGACAGLHALTWEITQDRRAAWLAALLYATHPFILYYSRVPYQEPLLLAGVAWGFYYLFRPASTVNRLLSSLFIGVACFSRYEGWIAALIAAAFQIRQSRQREGKIRLPAVVRSLLTYGWAPVAWIAWNKDLSPVGTYVLDLGIHWRRFYRPYFIAKSALWWTESAVVLMALIGLARSLIDTRISRNGRFPTLLGFLVLLLVALLFSGHGIEPDAERLVTEREAFIPVGILVIYSGLGASWLIDAFRRGSPQIFLFRLIVPLLAVLVVTGYSLDRGIHRVASANADPDLKTDYQVSQFLVGRQASGLVLAAPLPIDPMKTYLRSVERWSGPKGREKAGQLLTEVETTPLDYQRILTFSWMPKSKLFPADELRGFDRQGIERFLCERGIDCLIILSDFRPASEHERILISCLAENHPPDLEICNGNKSARIYMIRSWLCHDAAGHS